MDYKIMGLKIHTFANIVKREMDKDRSQHCEKMLSVPHAKFLSYLIRHKNKDVYQKNLEEAFSLRPPTVSRSLKALEQQGYITRTPGEHDCRLKKIKLTEKTLAISDSLEDSMKGILQKMVKGISDEELEAFFGTLDKMKSNLTD
jgi:DNA-binding MarR family transcriptional regulator